jgi:hypothetical protein
MMLCNSPHDFEIPPETFLSVSDLCVALFRAQAADEMQRWALSLPHVFII